MPINLQQNVRYQGAGGAAHASIEPQKVLFSSEILSLAKEQERDLFPVVKLVRKKSRKRQWQFLVDQASFGSFVIKLFTVGMRNSAVAFNHSRTLKKKAVVLNAHCTLAMSKVNFLACMLITYLLLDMTYLTMTVL